MSELTQYHLDGIEETAEQVVTVFLEDFLFDDKEQATDALKLLRAAITRELGDGILDEVAYEEE